jgi:hypothetical protein
MQVIENKGIVGIVNWHGSAASLTLDVPFRRRLKSSFEVGMSVECRNMTAIVSTYVPEQGFVIGADGLRTDANSGEIVTENATKIFSIAGNGVQLAYAWAGASSLWFGEREFNFLKESENIRKELSVYKPESIDDYAQEFAVRMHQELRAVCLPDGRLSLSGSVLPNEDIAHVLLVGYYNGKPYRTGVRFSHKNLFLQAPFRDEIIESPSTFHVFSGSDVILQKSQPLGEPNSLEEAANLIQRYIQSCVDNRDNFSDCSTIGGHVHVATLTAERFEWAISPLPDIVVDEKKFNRLLGKLLQAKPMSYEELTKKPKLRKDGERKRTGKAVRKTDAS